MRDLIEKALAILGMVTALSAALGALDTVAPFLTRHIIEATALFALLSVFLVWPRKAENPVGFGFSRENKMSFVQKYIWVIGVSLAYCIILIFMIWEFRFREVDGPRVFPNPLSVMGDFLVSPAFAQSAPASGDIELVRFGLATDLTTFEERSETDLSLNSNAGKLRSFAMPHEWFRQINPNTCMREVLAIYQDALEGELTLWRGLRRYAEITGRLDVLPYIENSLTRINLDFHTRRPDITKKLFPTQADWMMLEDAGPEGIVVASTVMRWMKYCVGVPYPVFELVLKNNSEQDIAITSIDYLVEDIGGYRGFADGVDIARQTYVFDLAYEAGTQSHQLQPIFIVPKGEIESFVLRLFTSHDDVGLSWKMKVALNSDQGVIETDTFQILMSGSPSWAPGRFK